MQNKTPKFKVDFKQGLSFKLQKEKVVVSTDPEIKYSYIYSRTKTLSVYKDILSSLPLWKGAVIIYGHNSDLLKPIDCTYSEYNLKETFSKKLKKSTEGEDVSRFLWMEDLLLKGNYKELIIIPTQTFN
jgi:hypothetical protein